MTAAHILILAAFVLIGGLGLAVMQQAIADCARHLFGPMKRKNVQAAPFGGARRAL